MSDGVFSSAAEAQTAYPAPWTVGRRVFAQSGQDAHGNPVWSWSDPVPQPVYAWAPAGTSEPFQAGRDAVTWDLDLFAPPGFTAGPRDRFVVDGTEFEVEGMARDFTHGPFGFTPGVVLRLKRVEG